MRNAARRAVLLISTFKPSSIRSRFGKAADHRHARRRMLAAADRPERIVVGPWTSEVGFELLYWIPTLRWLLNTQGVASDRVVALSRGNTHAWYTDIADSYVDVLDYCTPDELRNWMEVRLRDTRTQKQRQVADADREILARASEEIGDRFSLIHPSLMYQMYRTFWLWRKSRRPLSRVLDHTEYSPLKAKSADAKIALPESYIAVKAYFSRALPDTPANREFWNALVASLAARSNVVILSADAGVDEHRDYTPAGGQRLHELAEHLTPRNNLDVQTSVVKGAEALFTTYGGFAYLGPMLDVPTYAFYSESSNVNPQHLEVMARAQRILHTKGVRAGLTAARVDDFSNLSRLIGRD